MSLISGTREEFTQSMAIARMPMNAAHVRSYIDKLEAGNPNRNARKRMAELALKHANITDDGRAVWVEYLGSF
jgi:hypothetical protein